MGADADVDALRRLAGLRHDKVADVRNEASKAADALLTLDAIKPLAHLLAVEKSAPPVRCVRCVVWQATCLIVLAE